MGYQTLVDLVILHVVNFHIILVMSWLSPYHDILDYQDKTMTIDILRMTRLEWKGEYNPTPIKLNSFICSKRLIRWGCLAFLAHLHDTSVEVSPIESVNVV